MKTTRSLLIFAIILCASSASQLLAQGYYWESTMSGGPMTEHTTKYYMMPKIIKVEQEGMGQETIVTDLTKKIILRIHDADKTYSLMTFDEMTARMKQMSGDAGAKMEELRAKMKEMPEDQRKMIEKMMGPMAADSGNIEIKKTNEKKTIAGLACTKAEIVQGDKPLMTVWTTKDLKGFSKLRADWEEFSQRMTEQMPGKMGRGIAAGMKMLDGFPMQTEIGDIVSTVTKIEPRSTPASAFEAPADYKKIDEPLFENKMK
jgi:hypothetical protein